MSVIDDLRISLKGMGYKVNMYPQEKLRLNSECCIVSGRENSVESESFASYKLVLSIGVMFHFDSMESLINEVDNIMSNVNINQFKWIDIEIEDFGKILVTTLIGEYWKVISFG